MKANIHLILLTLSLLSHICSAGHQRHVFHLNESDGVSSRHIRNINQDARGFIWVATSDGLNRFDGRKFESFTKENSGLPSNEVNDIIPDPSDPDRMWIATRTGGVSVYDRSTGKIQAMPDVARSLFIPSLSPASGGKIWITNYLLPPDLFDPASGKTESLYGEVPVNFPDTCWCAVESPDGKSLYIGHDGAGFTVVDLKTKRFVNYRHDPADPSSVAGSHVHSIYPDSDGNVWLGTDRGVSVYDPSEHTFLNIISSEQEGALLPGDVWSIREMNDGDLWFGTGNGGISILHAADRLRYPFKFDRLTHSSNLYPDNNISSSSVFCLFEDSYGNRWVGNQNNGIDVVSYSVPFFNVKKPFPHKQMARPQQAVWSTACDRDGNLWVGGENEILQIGDFPPRSYTLPLDSKDCSTLVKTILCDGNGELWLGTNNSGILIFNPRSKVFRAVGTGDIEITRIIEDRDGSKLIATRAGMYRCGDGVTVTRDDRLNKLLPDMMVMSMLLDSSGSLWLGTFGRGIVKVTGTGKALQLEQLGGLPSNTVNDIFEDDNGRIWVATREGAAVVDPHALKIEKTFTESDGLPNTNVKSIQQDGAGNIWLATNKGLACYNRNTGQLAMYSRSFGSELPFVIENSGSFHSTMGLFFGTFNGLLQVNTSTTAAAGGTSRLVLNRLIAYDRDSPDHNMTVEIPVSSDHISLPYNMNTFTLKFADLDITHAANADYRYNMKGVNEVWTPMSWDNMALYRDLKPGKYDFQIRHRLNGGDWSEPVTLLCLTITPPFYLTWWAKLLFAILVLTIIVVVTLFYKHKLSLEQKLAIERENSKNGKILNEERLTFFTNITHELRTPLSLIVGPIEDMVNDENLNQTQRKKLLTIRTSSMRLLNLINGILEFRKTETRNRKLEVVYGNLSNHVREIGLRYKELNNRSDVSISIEMEENDEIFTWYDPEVISTVVNNLMSNAMKYTHKGSIVLSLRVVEERGVEYVELRVTDTGEGIPPESLPHIFERYYQAHHNKKISGTGIGLALTKNLVDLHEGSIEVESESGEGSAFTMRLVLRNNYPSAIHREDVEKDGKPDLPEQTEAVLSDNTLKMLVVEDDPDVREYVAQSFGDGFKVYVAANGREGLEMVRHKYPDIVVSDIMMPEMNGIELCSAIKSDFMTSHIPVILLTAKDSLLDKEAGYASGADSYVTKPFSANLLKARVNNIIESRHKLTVRFLGGGIVPQPAEESGSCQGNAGDNDGGGQDNAEQVITKLDSDFIRKFRQFVDENIDMVDLDVPFMADKMNMSHSTLYRKIKSITGVSPNEFIRKIRLAKASALLATGEMSVTEVSYAAGFNGPTYFRRVFKAEYGKSPTQFIAEMTGKNPEKIESDNED